MVVVVAAAAALLPLVVDATVHERDLVLVVVLVVLVFEVDLRSEVALASLSARMFDLCSTPTPAEFYSMTTPAEPTSSTPS